MAINGKLYGTEKRHILSACYDGDIVFEQVRGGHNADWIVKQFKRSCRREKVTFDLVMIDGQKYKPGMTL